MDPNRTEPSQMDALLWMMTLDELEEALDVVVSWKRSGTIAPSVARLWEERIRAWTDCRQNSLRQRSVG